MRAAATRPARSHVNRSACSRACAARNARSDGSAAARRAETKRLEVRREQEALARRLVLGRQRPVGQRHAPGGDAPAALGRHEVVGRPAVGHDHGPPARQRLERRQAEALAAVRLHEHIAGPVERRDLGERQVLVEQHELGRPGHGLERADGVVGRLALVERARAERLEHQAHVVVAREGASVGLEQDVDPFAVGHPANEQEDSRLLCRKRARRPLRREVRRVDPVRDDVDELRRHARRHERRARRL